MAQPLAGGAKPALRRAAKEVLVDAYLGAARDIGHGRWQHQATVVPKWLERALAQADDVVAVERGETQVRLHVYEEALAALASITEPPDAAEWIQGASELGATLVKEAADPAHKAALAWRLGVALGDATEIEAARVRRTRRCGWENSRPNTYNLATRQPSSCRRTITCAAGFAFAWARSWSPKKAITSRP